MNISAMMGQQLASLQQALNISILNKQMVDGAAQATAMLQDMANVNAPHPTLGNSIDLKA